ncbi:MAG: alanine--tRNA ligase-related protein [Acidobacteriota bacterium]|nr:alanine--tRNA ligase-related protein [Acidobacteriota bacterium]
MPENVISTKRLYFDDAYRTDFEAKIIARTERGGKPAVILDATCFYPEAGGQPADRGTLNGVDVADVVEDGERILHVLDVEISSDEVRGRVDGRRRFDHMQQHSGQHILSQAFIEILRGETRSFHMGEDVSTLEIGIANVSDESLDRVERRANEVVFEDRPVKFSFVPQEEIGNVPLRRPPKVEGIIRVVEVEGFDFSACGGTHCRRTGEIGLIKVLGWERIRGNLRFTFVCGGRALSVFQVRNRIVRGLIGQFNVRDRDLPAAVERISSDLKEAKRRTRKLEESLAVHESAEFMAKADEGIIRAVLADRSPEAVRALALNIIRRGNYVVLFGWTAGSQGRVLLAASEGSGLDLRMIIPEIQKIAPVKGGGSPSLVELVVEEAVRLETVLDQALSGIRKK